MSIRASVAGRADATNGLLTRSLAALLWLEPFWIALLALPLTFPGRFLPIRYTPTLIFLLFIFWPVRGLRWRLEARQGLPSPRLPHLLSLPILLLLATIPVSLAITDQRRAGWLLAAYLAVGLALCVAFIHWPVTRRRPGLLVFAVIALGIALALLGPVVAQGSQWRVETVPAWQLPLARWVRTLGETVNANILAGGLVLAPPMLFGLVLGMWPGSRQTQAVSHSHGWAAWLGRVTASALCLASAWWMLSVLRLTDSRGAWLATAASLIVLFIMRWPWLRRPALILGGALVVWIVWVGPVTVLTPVMQGGLARDYNGRMEIYARSAGLLARHPLTGIGLGAFERAIIEDAPQVRVPITPGLPHAHNMWLQVGLDLGLFGVVAYTWLLAGSAWLFWRTWQRRKLHAHGGLALAGMGSLVALAVHGLVDAPLWNSKLASLPWLIFALAVLLSLPPASTPLPTAAKVAPD